MKNSAPRALYTLTGQADMDTISLRDLTVTAQVSIITRAGTGKLNLEIDRLHIAACDFRRYSEQRQKLGQREAGRRGGASRGGWEI